MAVGCRGCILDDMGENTYRHALGALGVREAAGAARGPIRRIAAPGEAPTSHGGQSAQRTAAASRGDAPSARRVAAASRRTSLETPRAAGARTSRQMRGAARGSTSHRPPGALTDQAIPARSAAPASSYWGRRFVVLAVGLTALAAAAWSMSESLRVHAGPNSSASSRDGSPGRAASRLRTGSPVGGSHAATLREESPAGVVKGGAWSAGRHSPGFAPSHSSAPSPSVTAGASGGVQPAFCSWHSIVLSLAASQLQFGSGERPDFKISVVSTQPDDCSFNVGPGHLALVIKDGPARIWSSADCVNGPGDAVTALKRGVPTMVTIGWNRETSSPGCAGPVQPVSAGSYTAYATDGSLASAPMTVRLS
jgi:hypothetical protein